MPIPTATHVVLLPVKPPARGKSRLASLDPIARRRLAEAFALDTAAACLACPTVGAVLAVTDDALFSHALVALGCAAIPDGVTDDLNATLRQAAAEARRRWPALTPVALLGDLPALSPDDLSEALASVRAEAPAYVADADGLGTTLYTAPHDDFAPRFGAGSRAAHELLGATPIAGELASLRRDVDELDGLRYAAALGLGPQTSAVVAELDLL
ncbi:2-phospho-L-lactate guanylyltransferase [Nocardioides sp.]|uniref:2-phospho-L-lactate guanylyltransferase n=1 Tax=Nocardioides sp. TaxID=35761 RepID=UPI0039E2EB3A